MARWISSIIIVTALGGTAYAQYRTPYEDQRLYDYLKSTGFDVDKYADPLGPHDSHTGIFANGKNHQPQVQPPVQQPRTPIKYHSDEFKVVWRQLRQSVFDRHVVSMAQFNQMPTEQQDSLIKELNEEFNQNYEVVDDPFNGSNTTASTSDNKQSQPAPQLLQPKHSSSDVASCKDDVGLLRAIIARHGVSEEQFVKMPPEQRQVFLDELNATQFRSILARHGIAEDQFLQMPREQQQLLVDESNRTFKTGSNNAPQPAAGNPTPAFIWHKYLDDHGISESQFDQLPQRQQDEIVADEVKSNLQDYINGRGLYSKERKDDGADLALFFFLLCSGCIAAGVGKKHGHRKWTSFLAGFFLGPIGVALAFSKLTLQPVTKPSVILRAEVVQPAPNSNQPALAWPQYRPDQDEPYIYS